MAKAVEIALERIRDRFRRTHFTFVKLPLMLLGMIFGFILEFILELPFIILMFLNYRSNRPPGPLARPDRRSP